MKLTKDIIRQLIKEEISQTIKVDESSMPDYEKEILKLKGEFEAAKSNPEKQKEIRNKIDALYNAYLNSKK